MTIAEYAMMIAGEKWLSTKANEKYDYYRRAEEFTRHTFSFPGESSAAITITKANMCCCRCALHQTCRRSNLYISTRLPASLKAQLTERKDVAHLHHSVIRRSFFYQKIYVQFTPMPNETQRIPSTTVKNVMAGTLRHAGKCACTKVDQ